MKVISGKKDTIFLESIDEKIEIVGEIEKGRATKLTGVDDKLKETYRKIKTTIKTIAEDIGADLKNINEDNRPKEVEMEFNIGVSSQIGPILVVIGKGDCSFKVKMKWELSKDGK